MIYIAKCKYVGMEGRKSEKTGKYYKIVRFIDEYGKMNEFIAGEENININALEQFADTTIKVNIEQGKYPKFQFLEVVE